jgi:hypothetical protein
MMLNVKQISILATLPLLVMGCTQGQESFSTEPGKGFGWKNMTDTSNATHNQMNEEAKTVSLATPTTGVVLPLTTSPNLIGVTRIPEQYLKVWFAPHQDGLGNLHEECVIHTVIQTGQWMVPTIT